MFTDRFSFPAASGISPDIDDLVAATLSDEEIAGLSPELNDMANDVRRTSVLLRNKTTFEIYKIITGLSDPQISMHLGSAKYKENNRPVFAGLDAIKEVMFADSARGTISAINNRNLFAGGIRRVCVILTASIMIGQLAQLTEQNAHSERLYDNAIADLDRLIEVYKIEDKLETLKEKEEEIPGGFFFEPKKFTVPAEKEVLVEWQSPGQQTGWSTVGVYTGEVETWHIVSELNDAINTQIGMNINNSLLAAPILSGPFASGPTMLTPTQLHQITFYPRKVTPGVIAYSINVRINVVLKTGEVDRSSTAFPVNQAPFLWGVHSEYLNNYIINGSIIALRNNKVLAMSDDAQEYKPFVLYLRNKNAYTTETSAPDNTKIRFRCQPFQPNLALPLDEDDEELKEIEILINRIVGDSSEQLELDNNRFSQVALALAEVIAQRNVNFMLSTALIRNDPPGVPNPVAALELIAWSRSSNIASILLDILEVPADIEIATGDRFQPLTPFSSKPRSVVVANPFSPTPTALNFTKLEAPMSKRRARAPKFWQQIKEDTAVMKSWGRYDNEYNY